MIMPYQRNPHFTSRDELLDELYVRLCETKSKQYKHRMALYGLGGVGKTQTAIEYVYRNENIYEGIFWVSAVDEVALLSGFQEIANRTRCVTGAKNLKSTDVAKRVLLWLQQQASWLMIFDNLDDVSIIKDYLPDVGAGRHTLITTRNPNVISIPAQGLEVGLLDVHSASELLCTRSGVTIDSTVESDAVAIVTALGFLPLAIEQAAAYIREASKDISTFLETYQQHRPELHKRMPSGNRDYKSSVATTWQLAFDVIERENPQAGELLRLFAFLNSDLISLDFLRAGVSGLSDTLGELVSRQLVFQEALFLLERFSVIKRSHEGIVIHRLVQSVIKDDMDEIETRRVWNATIGLCNAAFPKATSELRAVCRRFQEQVTILLFAPASQNSVELGETLGRIGAFLQQDGKYKDAEAFDLKSVDVFSLMFQKNDPILLTAIHRLHLMYAYNGKLEEAVQLGIENLQARTIVLGEPHPDTLCSMASLAWTHALRGHLTSAQKLQERCSELRVEVLGEEHPDTLHSMNDLAWIYQNQGRLVDAQMLQERCLELRVKVLGEKHPDTLTSMSKLAWVYQLQGKLVDAQNLQERCLEFKVQVLGEKHPDTLHSMNDLAWIYQLRGRLVDAQNWGEKCVKLRVEVLGEKHPDTLTSMSNLAWIYQTQGKLVNAHNLHKRCLELKIEVIGEKHTETLLSLTNLGLSYKSQGLLDEAQKLQEKCLNTYMEVVGPEHYETLNAMTNLAITYRLQGRIMEALDVEEKSLATKQRVLGNKHVFTMESVMNLAAIYSTLGRVRGSHRNGREKSGTQEDGFGSKPPRHS